MPYSIFMLPEGLIDVTINGVAAPNGLDGVTQGSGIHLDPSQSTPNATITLTSNAWEEIVINDNDANFQDSDNSQTLVNTETLDGVTYPAGSIAEAEYGITVQDGAGNTYQLVAFNIRHSSDSNPYGNVEGLAFIGPQGGFPPIGQPLTVIGAQEGPSHTATTYATPTCFARGTRIATPGGEVLIEDLSVGDRVVTAEGGAEAIRWIGRRTFPAKGACAPVVFETGAIGNTRPLRVSRQHRLLLSGWKAQLHFGVDAVWVPAVHFLVQDGVHVAEGGVVEYFHILMDGHRTLRAEGVEAESLHPGDIARGGFDAATRAELERLFPELFNERMLSHPPVTGAEAPVLVVG